MQTLKLFLAPQVAVPDNVLQAAGAQLKSYFDQVCMNQAPRMFLSATVKINPHAGEVGDRDLLVYITDESSIVRLMDRVFEPGVDHAPMLSGHGGGGTATMPDGRVRSEVYWGSGLNALKTSTQDLRATALANLIFHEWAHNKHASDSQALSKGEASGGQYVHLYCGFGVLQRGLAYGALGRIHNISANISAMARVIGAQNKQSISGLYNDDLGF
ncbi:MAG TPA: hypothetical protein VMU05_00305 [Dongiaceae bacterium]|nr:hypothetical protein [Dongiaceae bacterium]